ncbi:MAG TPA: hypothetical protein VEA80_01695 [Vitreimonas sp.]|uniref:hypothetical protein n=1 Tax=Vitreimonas sp. TaxID=3069702 RepID=UPI002D298E1B|nr:hypothetical protein [Vitreimonas sp.]HYD86163.1 hypothetical protein [Vitreimonas sp.]
MSTSSPALRHAPLEFWRIAEAFLQLLHNLFGAPEDIAAQHTLTRAAHTLLSSWLSAGEAMLRRLLLIEAAAYPSPASPRTRRGHKRVRKLMSFTPDKPEEWRVSFAAFYGPSASRRPASGREMTGQGGEAPARLGGFASAWPLAERFEAMIRVFNAPQAYARRLARRLRADPGCAGRILRAPPTYAHRVDQAERLTAAAEAALPKDDSS